MCIHFARISRFTVAKQFQVTWNPNFIDNEAANNKNMKRKSDSRFPLQAEGEQWRQTAGYTDTQWWGCWRRWRRDESWGGVGRLWGSLMSWGRDVQRLGAAPEKPLSPKTAKVGLGGWRGGRVIRLVIYYYGASPLFNLHLFDFTFSYISQNDFG